MDAMLKSVARPRGKPFPPGDVHPRHKRGKAAVPLLADGRSLYDLFRSYTEDAAKLLAAVMDDTSEDIEIRVKAAGIILQRGWGDAPKEATLRLVGSNEAGALSETELLALAMKLLPPPITVEQVAGDAAD